MAERRFGARKLVALAAVVGTLAPIVALEGAQAAAPKPVPVSLHLETDGPFTDGQDVQITGTAGVDASGVLLLRCQAGAVAIRQDCEGSALWVNTEGARSWVARIELRRYLALAGGEYDCQEGCVVMAALDGWTSPRLIARTRVLRADPTTPVQRQPRLALEGATPFAPGSVTVNGSRFAPHATVTFAQCTTPVPYCVALGGAIADANGELSAEITLRHLIPRPGRVTDCVLDTCSIIARTDSNRRQPNPLTLEMVDPAAAAAPVVTIHPGTPLVSGDVIRVDVTDPYAPYLWVEQCRLTPGAADAVNDCQAAPIVRYTPVASDRVRFTIQPSRTMTTGDGRFVDCAEPASQCVLVASGEDRRGTAPLSFDPFLPIPAPLVGVSPSTQLADGQEVQLDMQGHVGTREIYQCPTMVDPVTSTDAGCVLLTSVTPAPSSATVSVRRYVGHRQRIDCARPDATCAVVVTGAFGSPMMAPITFGSLAPFREPAITVTPHRNLADRQQVDIHIDADEPGWRLQQCVATRRPGEPRCVRLGLFDVDVGPTGTTAVTYPHRYLERHTAPVDCASRRCWIESVSPDGFVSDTQPLRFAPEAAPSPGPYVEVGPVSVDLADLTLRTSVAGALYQCVSGSSRSGEPDCIWRDSWSTPTRPEAVTHVDLYVPRFLDLGGHVVDCASTAGRCELRFIPLDRSLTATAPLEWLPVALVDAGPLEVTPGHIGGLRAGQHIEMTISGIRSDLSRLDIRQCLVTRYGIAEATCRYPRSWSSHVESDGGPATIGLRVRRRLLQGVDCVRENGACAIVFRVDQGPAWVTRAAYLSFSRDPPRGTP